MPALFAFTDTATGFADDSRAQPMMVLSVSFVALSATERITASASPLSAHVRRRYMAFSPSSARTTPVVRSRSCTPLPNWSRCSMV